jgi:hypothetical protein
MLSSVLHSPQAVQVNVEIMRVFVRIRRVLAVNADIGRRLDEVERRVAGHDEQFLHVIRAIRKLMEPPEPPTKRSRIGFQTSAESTPSNRASRAKKRND